VSVLQQIVYLTDGKTFTAVMLYSISQIDALYAPAATEQEAQLLQRDSGTRVSADILSNAAQVLDESRFVALLLHVLQWTYM